MLPRQLILLSLSCLLSAPLAMAATPKAEEAKDSSNNTSLDSMWIDQEAPTIDKDTDTNVKGSAGTVASVSGITSIVAPMCAFDDFRASSLVSKGSWPGLGPFKASKNDISELSDDKQNYLKVNVKSDKVTAAQLGLGKLGTGNVRDFLDIEMASDFLLESLGAKPRKIAEFNKQLEKSKAALKPGGKAFSMAAGRYQVTLDRSSHAHPYSCMIAVNSLDANKTILAEHGSNPADEVAEPKPESKPASLITSLINKKPAKGASAAINPPEDAKRDEFVATIKAWQQVKKVALKKRDGSHLGDILFGTALSKQTTAVKWLQTHGNYYDMEPRGCVVESYTDLGGGKKYSVVAQVREFSKYIREADNSVLKEVDDKYVVNYTIEKVNDKWMITDSAVVTTSQASHGAAPASGKAH